MTLEEFEELGLTEEDEKLIVVDGEFYFKFNTSIETVNFEVTFTKGGE